MVKSRIVKRGLKLFTQTVVVGVITLFLFEISFRIYIIDFYAGTFEALNSEIEESNNKPTLMVVGDSFSAFPDGYTKVLHDSLTQYSVRNISVPGTSVREQYLFGRYYLKRENPEILIFQFYVGNDLVGWRHNLNWMELSFARNLYWALSEEFWSLGYLNYRLSPLLSKSEEIDIKRFVEKPFNTELYTQRDKYYLRSEPALIENAAYLKNGRDRDFEQYLKLIQDLYDFAPDDTQILMLMIPHCSQVTEQYKVWTEEIGAKFSDQFETGVLSYPLYDNAVKQFEGDKRIKVLNPIFFMKEMERRGYRLYFNNDSHLNQLGQELIGQYLLNYLATDESTTD